MTSEILVPFINANDDVVELEQWYVKDGQLIQKEQQVAELATSKVNVVVLSEVNGFVKTLCKAGDRLPVGSPVALLFSEWAEYENYIESHVAKFETVSANNFAPSVGSHGFSRFSESAVEFIQSQGLDPDRFAGMGLVTSQTVKNFINPAPMQRPEPVPVVRPSFFSTFKVDPAIRSKRVGRAKSLEIENLSIGQSGLINSSLTVQLHAEPLIKMLRHYNAFNGSSLPVIIYELAHLLKATPSLTAFYNQNEIYFYDAVHVGVAMDVGKGLKVVTLRDTAKLMPAQIFENLTDFAMRDIEGMLTEQDITGSTFTVTDLSAQNILQHQPLINGRQSGILGVGADAALAGHPMTLTLTFDHRVLTGREAATFLNTLKRKILAFTLPTPSDES